MKKSFRMLTCALLTTVLLAGCGTPAAGPSATTTAASGTAAQTTTAAESAAAAESTVATTDALPAVEVSIVYATGDQVSAELMHQRVVDFMAAHPGVTITEKLSNEGAYLDAIKTLDAVGELPDIIEMRDTPLFVRAGKLGELPADITGLFANSVPFDGKIYTAPISNVYPNGIIYSKKAFADAGVQVEDIKTYDDFLAACGKIKDTGIAPIVVGGSDIWHIGFWWSYFWLNHVAVDNPNWIADRYAGKASFTDASVKAAMEDLNKLFQSGYVEKGWASTAESQCPSILVSGQAAMYYTGPFSFTQIQEADPSFEFGFFALPNQDGKFNVTGGVTPGGWAINAETQKDADKTKVVYVFIREFFEKETYTAFCKRASAIPSLIEDISYETGEQMASALEIAKTADSIHLNWNQNIGENELPPNFRNFCYKLVSEWFLNVSTVEDGLKTMDAEWENVTKDFNPVLKK